MSVLFIMPNCLQSISRNLGYELDGGMEEIVKPKISDEAILCRRIKLLVKTTGC